MTRVYRGEIDNLCRCRTLSDEPAVPVTLCVEEACRLGDVEKVRNSVVRTWCETFPGELMDDVIDGVSSRADPDGERLASIHRLERDSRAVDSKASHPSINQPMREGLGERELLRSGWAWIDTRLAFAMVGDSP